MSPQPLYLCPSVEDQLCRGKVVVLRRGLQLSTGCTGSVVSQVVQAKISPHMCSALGHPAGAIKQSEMAASCAVLRDSQVRPCCESRLVAASARPGA